MELTQDERRESVVLYLFNKSRKFFRISKML